METPVFNKNYFNQNQDCLNNQFKPEVYAFLHWKPFSALEKNWVRVINGLVKPGFHIVACVTAIDTVAEKIMLSYCSDMWKPFYL